MEINFGRQKFRRQKFCRISESRNFAVRNIVVRNIVVRNFVVLIRIDSVHEKISFELYNYLFIKMRSQEQDSF